MRQPQQKKNDDAAEEYIRKKINKNSQSTVTAMCVRWLCVRGACVPLWRIYNVRSKSKNDVWPFWFIRMGYWMAAAAAVVATVA